VSLQRIYQRLSVGITANIGCQVKPEEDCSRHTVGRLASEENVLCR
jgi:hypothetical protein